MKNIPKDRVLALEIDTPSEDEQRAIADTLQCVDRLLTSLEQVIAKKRAIKQGMMQELLTGRTRLPGFGGGWTERKFAQLVSIRNGQVDPRLPRYSELTLIAPDHIEQGTGRLLAKVTARDQHAISGKYQVSRGDIVYGKINPHLQKLVLADEDALCSADMYPLTVRNGIYAPFIFHLMLSDAFTKFTVSLSRRSGIPKVNRVELAGFSALVPSEREQVEIGDTLEAVDAEIRALERRLEATRAIKQGMMQELLTGRTRLMPTEATA
jgi:type I restriction enzyme S subunit